MLQQLYGWIQNIAVYLIVAAAVMHAIPGKDYGKYVRFFSGLVLILLLFTPVMSLTGMSGRFQELYQSGLYEMEKAETADKYSMFLYGNQGYVTIEGRGEGRVLVVKDSYANSLVPYLIENYAEICVIDPRSYRNSIDALMQREQFDQVLLLFSFQTYSTTNISSYLAASAGEG